MHKLREQDIRILTEGPQIKKYIERLYGSVNQFYNSFRFSISLKSLRTYLSRDVVSSETLKCSLVNFLNTDYNEIVLSEIMQVCKFVNEVHNNIIDYREKDNLPLFNKLLDLSRKYELISETAKMYRAIAHNFYYRNEVNNSIEYFELAIFTIEKYDMDNLVLFYCELANVYFRDNKLDLAEEHYGIADNYVDEYSLCSNTLFKYYFLRGTTYLNNKTDYARELFYQALINCSDNIKKANTIEKIALTYEIAEIYQTAIHYYIDAINYYEDNTVKISLILNNISNIYIHLKLYDKAMENIEKAIELIDSTNESCKYIKYLHTKTIIYVLCGKEGKALYYFEAVKRYKDFYDDKNTIIEDMTYIISIIKDKELLREIAKLVVQLYI